MRSPERFEPIDGAAAREVRPVRVDLGSREAVEESCAALGEDLGRIDLLVNNAGLVTGGLLEEQDLPPATTYAASKAGVVAFTESLRREHQSLLRRSGELAERVLDVIGQTGTLCLLGRGDLLGRYVAHGGSSCLVVDFDTPQAPNRSGRGGRTAVSKIYGLAPRKRRLKALSRPPGAPLAGVAPVGGVT